MARSRDPETKPEKGLSRRAFLSRGAGLAITAPIVTGTGLPAPQGAAADVKILGPEKVPITLRVNGKSHTLNVEPRVTLLDALRVDLDYTGAKKVCDRAVCGTCTVIMGGKVVYACSVLAVEAQAEGRGPGRETDDVPPGFDAELAQRFRHRDSRWRRGLGRDLRRVDRNRDALGGLDADRQEDQRCDRLGPPRATHL